MEISRVSRHLISLMLMLAVLCQPVAAAGSLLGNHGRSHDVAEAAALAHAAIHDANVSHHHHDHGDDGGFHQDDSAASSAHMAGDSNLQNPALVASVEPDVLGSPGFSRSRYADLILVPPDLAGLRRPPRTAS
jgi:hypothetical protein